MNQTIKAALFDIDRTLLAQGTHEITPRNLKALEDLRNAGVTLIVATGRAPFAARDALGKFEPDYLVCATGALVQDRAGKPVYANYMTQEEMYALVDYCEDYELPLDFVYDEGYVAYVEYEKLKQLSTSSSGKFVLDGEDQVRHLQGLPYVACVYALPGQFDGFFEKYGHLNLRTLPFANGCGFHDVVHENDDKADSIEMLLNRLGLTWEQTAAFGDGLNDEKMLSCAGMPVVMENGEDNLKLPGRVIAPACKDDGVAQVIETLLLK